MLTQQFSILGFNLPLLSLLVFLPLLGAASLYVSSGAEEQHGTGARRIAFLWSLLVFGLSLGLLTRFDSQNVGQQFVESYEWIPTFGIHYALGVDGISLFLVILTTFLMPIVVIASRSVHSRLRGYLANMLILEAAMIGTLVSLDAFLFYIFWELMLFPMYFLIGIWGGKRRIYATLKFVLYTVFGSLLMLVALLVTVYLHYQQSEEISFLISDLIATNFPLNLELWLFAAFALAFAIKVPIFPFHTWLPDAHVEAPTGGSVVLAGVLLKMGLYGFIRFAYPLFPRAAEEFTPYIATLAVIGIIYGALVAWVQTDIKKLVAYSSVSHLGYCVLGFVAFNTMSTTGSIYQMLNHGISTGALFLLVGVLYDRRHTREISEYGGLTSKVPVFAFLFLVFTLSSIALPLTNGFIGEFLILSGSFQVLPIFTAISVLGVILGAIYMLTLYMRTMFGELDEKKNGNLTDVNRTELAAFIPLLVAVFYMGLFPNHIIKMIEPTVTSYIAQVDARRESLERVLIDRLAADPESAPRAQPDFEISPVSAQSF
jgi:NADH-quinone oxidoreductase subunit M